MTRTAIGGMSLAKNSHSRKSNSSVDADILAAVEAQLEAQRAEITTRLLAEKAARQEAERAEQARQAQIERERQAAANDEFSPEQIDQFRRMLRASGVTVVRRTVSEDLPDGAQETAEVDYSDTERVQAEISALLDLLGVVRVRDVQEHVFRADGAPMSASNVRYHMRKLSHSGVVKKVEERYKLPGLGWRTRDVWSKDPQKLFEVLAGKVTKS